MMTFTAVFLAAWATGYVIGYQHQMIKTAINAAT